MQTWTSEDGRIELLNCDCVEFMRGLPDKCYELAIVDPPYGIHDKLLRTGNTGALWTRKLAEYQNSQWDKAIPTAEYFTELMRVSVNQVIWGGNYFPLPPTRCVIWWDKCQPWENFSAGELAWTSFDKPAMQYRFDNRTGGKIHPTEKPVELYSYLLHRLAKEGDRILDTHGGSMSSVCACHEKGFAITCCELDADYYAAGLARVQKAMQQQTLDLGA
jgi:site-specific DNA-methyltransferase (adenine-specific)